VFLQNYQGRWIFFNYRIIFYWKFRGIGPQSHGLSPWSQLMSPRHSGSIWVIDSSICGLDFIKMKGYRWSNLGHWSRHGRLRRGQQGDGAVSGGTPRPRWWIAGAGHSSRYDAPFSMRFNPTDAAHRGELTYFERRGDQSRGHDGSRLAPSFGDVDDVLQRLANDKIRLHGDGATRRRATWCWLSVARSPMERWWARAVTRVSIFEDQNLS
jgi:hypothetical protein